MKSVFFLFSFLLFSGTVYSQTIMLDISGNDKKEVFNVQRGRLNVRLDSRGRLQNKNVSIFNSVGDISMKYDLNDRLSDIDGLVIEYDINGRVRQIGDKPIDYDLSGQIREAANLGDNLLRLYETIRSFNNKNVYYL